MSSDRVCYELLWVGVESAVHPQLIGRAMDIWRVTVYLTSLAVSVDVPTPSLAVYLVMVGRTDVTGG